MLMGCFCYLLRVYLNYPSSWQGRFYPFPFWYEEKWTPEKLNNFLSHTVMDIPVIKRRHPNFRVCVSEHFIPFLHLLSLKAHLQHVSNFLNYYTIFSMPINDVLFSYITNFFEKFVFCYDFVLCLMICLMLWLCKLTFTNCAKT